LLLLLQEENCCLATSCSYSYCSGANYAATLDVRTASNATHDDAASGHDDAASAYDDATASTYRDQCLIKTDFFN